MKRTAYPLRVIILSTALLIVNTLCFAQTKGDKKIIVVLKDTSNIFPRVADYLMDKGYDIDQKDESLGYINTAEKSMRKLSASQKIRIRVKDSVLTITGLIALDLEMEMFGVKNTRTFNPTEYRGMKGSPYMVAWNEMDMLAKYFGDKITYSK